MKIPISILPVDDKGFHIMIRGRINDLTANILVDTGASRTVFDINRKNHYFGEVPLIKYEKLFSGVGTEMLQTHSLVLPELKFGTYVINSLEVVVIDLDGVNKTYASFDLPRIDMVMGGDLLLACGGIIDYPKRELIFTREFNI